MSSIDSATSPKKSLLLILLTVALDGMGIGLILPILPTLVKNLSHTRHAETHIGVLMALYAAMQFLCSPILGVLSDRYGRRPVLLVSLAGAAADYVLMYFAPNMTVLYIGRILAGITGANVAVATAYIADVTSEDQRARGYGYMNACFGLGFVAGPALGGLAGAIDVRLPFLLAAVLNGINLLLALFLLPESHLKRSVGSDTRKLNPLGFFNTLFSFRGLLTLLTIFFMLHMIGQVPASLWIIYVQQKFSWDTRMVGYSFVAFGLLHAATQAFLTGPVTRRLGDVRVLLLGMLADSIAFLFMAFILQGSMVFLIVPLFCLGGIAMPAMQTLLSKRVDENEQGELQGVLVSLMSMAAIIGPLIFTQLYRMTSVWWIGTVWVVGASLYLLCIPVLWKLARQLKEGIKAT